MDNFRGALFNILAAKLRSFLAVLGILIGTASVVALVMSGQLATQHALEQFKALGTNLLAVNVYQQHQDKNQSSGVKLSSLTLQEAIDSVQADKRIQVAAPYTMLYAPVYYNDKNLNASVIGATDALQAVIKISLKSGRFISLLDNTQYYAVIGNQIAQQLQAMGMKKILGQQVVVGNNIFTIIGIADAWPENNFFEDNINNSIIIPIKTSLTLSRYSQIQNIVYRIDQNVDVDAIKTHLNQYINRYISEGQVFVRSPEQIIRSMNKQQSTFTILLGVIGGISLLVGGIGVMNIMLVSVVERRREIGIRRAVGARQANIRNLFLAESITLSLLGGILGVLIGILASMIIAKFFHWHFTFFAAPAVIGFAVSVFVGVFFGYYPAYRASKLDPILLLRSE
jgi:putative ABC transport system permease protein